MSATNSLHYQLCCEGAKYLLQPRAKERFQSQNKWSAVEIVCMGCEMPDVWATNCSTSTVIEVKTSVADFRNDQKKYCRSEQAEKAGHTLGNYRYYLCPEKIADTLKAELPDGWGLLVWNGKKVDFVVGAAYKECNKEWDLFIMGSILSREVGVHKVFNYRGTNPMGQIKQLDNTISISMGDQKKQTQSTMAEAMEQSFNTCVEERNSGLDVHVREDHDYGFKEGVEWAVTELLIMGKIDHETAKLFIAD